MREAARKQVNERWATEELNSCDDAVTVIEEQDDLDEPLPEGLEGMPFSLEDEDGDDDGHDGGYDDDCDTDIDDDDDEDGGGGGDG